MIQSISALIAAAPTSRAPAQQPGSDPSNKGFAQAWTESGADKKDRPNDAKTTEETANAAADETETESDVIRPDTPNQTADKPHRAQAEPDETAKTDPADDAQFNAELQSDEVTAQLAAAQVKVARDAAAAKQGLPARNATALPVRADGATALSARDAQKNADAAKSALFGTAEDGPLASDASTELPLKTQLVTAKDGATFDPARDRGRAAYAMLASQTAAEPPKTPVPTATAIPVPTLATAPLSLFEEHVLLDQSGQAALDAEGLAATQSTSSTSSTTTQGLVLNRTHAPQVASQIAMATVQSKAGTTEIALNPQELGRVRITLSMSDSGLAVSILSERPETADLMRRNIDILAAEFRDLGHENLSFTFGDQTGASDQNDQHGGSARHSADSAPQIPDVTPGAVKVALSGGLDLKF